MTSAAAAQLRVIKFGGTSVGDPERMAATAAIVGQQAAEGHVVVIVSAMARVTESLLRAATAASLRDNDTWNRIGAELKSRHLEVSSALIPAAERPAIEARLNQELATFAEFCAGFSLVREVPARSLDSLASLGEVMSVTLLAAILRARRLNAEAVDATELIVTDDGFGNAALIFEPSRERIRRRLGPLLDIGSVPVVTGFRAATRDGTCTTLGRGGSDYSATIVGAALPADEILIWTDVDGMMTADPQLVPDARVISELSYREAIELSFFGARVLHPKALELPFRANIPVLIKNGLNPSAAGTAIGGALGGRPGVRAIASTREAALFTVTGDKAVSFTRLAALVFGWLDADRVPTLVVTQSSAENVLSFAVNRVDAVRVRRRLERECSTGEGGLLVAGTEELADVGVVVAVGEGMKGTPGIAARIFGSLARLGINIAAIAQGSSELSVSLVVKSSDLPAAVRAMHDEFCL